jgi:hypothetical protein
MAGKRPRGWKQRLNLGANEQQSSPKEGLEHIVLLGPCPQASEPPGLAQSGHLQRLTGWLAD